MTRQIRITNAESNRVLAAIRLLAIAAIPQLKGADSGASVVVVYNSKMAESKAVADYYAKRRQVPASQVFGFELPATEAMTRAQYVEHLQKPLLKSLESNQLFTFGSRGKPEGSLTLCEPQRRLRHAATPFDALSYGVRTRILLLT